MDILIKHIDGEIQQINSVAIITGIACNWKRKLNATEQYAVNLLEKHMYYLYVRLAFITGC